jgi:hypothetical protein
MENGEPVQFEFKSTDATTAAVISIRSEGGSARTLASTERFILRSFTGSIAAAVLNAVIFDDANTDGNIDAGEIMAVLGLASANGCGLQQAAGPGRVPKVKAAVAGQVYIAGHGVIVNG